MRLEQLMDLFGPTAAAVRERYGPSSETGEAILNRLGVALTHLDHARFGAKLYAIAHSDSVGDKRIFHSLDENHVTIESASSNLVFRGVVSALDLCAAALWRLVNGVTSSNGEIDMRNWQSDDGKQLRKKGPAVLTGWVDRLLGDNRWNELLKARHSVSHRVVPRYVTVSAGNPLAGAGSAGSRTEMVINDRKRDLAELQPTCVEFGTSSWLDLGQLIVDNRELLPL